MRDSGKDLPAAGKSSPPEAAKIDLDAAVAQIRSYVSDAQRDLSFHVDAASGRQVITVTNPETGELIRQIPAEEVLKMAAALSIDGGRLIDTLV